MRVFDHYKLSGVNSYRNNTSYSCYQIMSGSILSDYEVISLFIISLARLRLNK